ncbi:hypothetical protein FEM48_Zijuj11G0124200 [Ziziphus jujuba var. spinosa]|uniref:Uncharacterized protein n=1 Tax=Ziziphus jujuba var. spinosa TaxID=714518 RepID=A0A978UIX4_ZIZJJ|nr:hypothetical protein FEM48_Zijuj11G0124200 [Ziziphus jujuba var. spinosa]
MKKFGDEQSNLLDQFERLTFEVQLNQAILGRSLSEPSTMGGSKMPLPSSMAQPPTAPPPPLVSQVRQGRRGWGFHKVLKKFLKPIFRRKGGSSGKKKMPADPKDQRNPVCFKFTSSIINGGIPSSYTTNPTRRIPSIVLSLVKRNQGVDKRPNRLQVTNLVDRIKALPTKERSEIIAKVEQVSNSLTICEFNDLLMAFVVAEEPDLALKFFANISSYGLVPDSQTLSIIIRCYCKNNNLDEAQRVLDGMVENGLNPNFATITIFINYLCKKGRLQRALKVLEVMGRIGYKPTVQIYNCLLKGLCYVGRVEEAVDVLLEIKKGEVKPDIYTYTAVMDGLCKVGRSDEAMELLVEALELGLKPDVVTFNTLFTGYSREGRPLEGIGVLKQMKEGDCRPDYISYKTLLHGLLKWEKARAAVRFYNEMVGIGFKVEESTMNTLVRGLCRTSCRKKGLLKDAHQLFEKMKCEGLVIDPSTYELMIQTLCIGKKTDEARINLKEMIEMGYSPGKVTLNNVIQALCEEGKVIEALPILVHANEEGRVPSSFSYNLLIGELNEQGNKLGACNVYGAALKRGMIPSRKPRQ